MLPRGLVTSQETGSEKNEWSTMTSYVSPETSLIILPPFAHLVTGMQRRERFGSGMKKLKRKITSSHVLVSTEFFCVNKSSSWAFLCFGLSLFLWQLSVLWQVPRWLAADSTFLVMPGRRGNTECQLRKTKLKMINGLLLHLWRCWMTCAAFHMTAKVNKLTEVYIKNICLCL